MLLIEIGTRNAKLHCRRKREFHSKHRAQLKGRTPDGKSAYATVVWNGVEPHYQVILSIIEGVGKISTQYLEELPLYLRMPKDSNEAAEPEKCCGQHMWITDLGNGTRGWACSNNKKDRFGNNCLNYRPYN